MSARTDLLAGLAATVGHLRSPLVAIDGPDAAGKTTLAAELAATLERLGRSVIKVSLDGFHCPAHERQARGALSPEGNVEDSYDLEALRRDVLEPLARPRVGLRHIVPARFDWRTEREVIVEPVEVPDAAVVLVEGVFLHRRDLVDRRDWSAFVFARPEVVLDRARVRDSLAMGGLDAVERRYTEQYLPGQALYFAREQPHRRATVCVENSDPGRPLISVEAVLDGVQRWIGAYGAR